MKINSFAMVAALMNLANAELQPEAKFRVDYTPNVIDVGGYPRVIAPDTPYVAAAGRDRLYFIDTRFDPESAAHIKQQIEWASVPDPDTYIQIDEIAITAEVRSASTNEVLFTFDPPYARVLFAAGINRKNPDAKLPEHMEAGDHIVRYDIGTSLLQKRLRCRDFGCWSSLDCLRDTGGVCDLCHHYYVNRECDVNMVNAIGGCPGKICARAVDALQKKGESLSDYYKRMDTMHWGSHEK